MMSCTRILSCSSGSAEVGTLSLACCGRGGSELSVLRRSLLIEIFLAECCNLPAAGCYERSSMSQLADH